MSSAEGYLSEPEFVRLWIAAHRAWCRHGELRGNAIVPDLSESEALSIAGLIGRARLWLPGQTAQVSLVKLDERLRAAHLAEGLAEVLVRRVGPLRSLPGERLAARDLLEHGWEAAAAHPAASDREELSVWLQWLRSAGLLTRVAGRSELQPFDLLASALDTVALLPCDPPEGLPAFAVRATGHTHNLDRGQPHDVLLLSALAHLEGVDRPRDAGSRRAMYDRYGLICDGLSNTVLCAGLSILGDSLAARKLRLSAEVAAPCVLTLTELQDVDRLEAEGEVIRICENPEVMATALERLGTSCAPLICTSGWPRVAALRLLDALARGGSRLEYHGDFDWYGVRIAAAMITRAGTELWRYDADNYRAGNAGPPLDPEPALKDLPFELAALVIAMRERGVSVAEEQVLDALIADLASTSRAG